MVRCPEVNSEQTTVLVEPIRLIDKEETTATHGLVILTAPSLPSEIEPGDLFIARATIGPVSSYGTPGVFNYKQFLEDQGIRIKGWIRTPALAMKIIRTSPPTWTDRIRYLPERVRFKISRFLTTSLPPETAGVYKAILLGDSSSLPPATEEAFKASGSIHLLSISGLHMALVALLSTGIISWFLKRSEWTLLHLPVTKISAVLSLIPLGAYAIIAGANPPVIRSLIMISVFIVALLIDRQWSIPTNIAIAALIILAVNPLQLFSASFQLSFTAVSAIGLFSPYVTKITTKNNADNKNMPTQRRILAKIKQWTTASFLISLAATLGTAPVLAFHFNRISLASPISTLLIEPVLCLWSLVLGLIACLFIGVPPIAHALLALGSPGITASLFIAEQFSHLPWLYLWVVPPSIPTIICWYATLILLASWPRLSRKTLLFTTLTCLGFWSISTLTKNNTSDLNSKVTVIDVGQGNAILIEVPGIKPILIDGGRKQARPGKGLDTGESLIAPYLWHQGIKRLSMIVSSHPDADHYNGIPFIMEHFAPETLWINGYESTDPNYQHMIAAAAKLKIKTQVPTPGMTLYRTGNISLKVISGGQVPTIPNNSLSSDNNQSLVLRLTHDKVSFLMPSDIEVEAEQALQKNPEINTDVLVAPHHGSATSSSAAFVTAVSPQYVAISAGKNQRGYFPAPTIVGRYQKINSTILNTAERGSIFFSTDGKIIHVKTYR